MASKNEAASRQPVTDCNRLGNVAKMREALEEADEKRISDAVIQSLRDKKLEMAGEIAAKEAEVAALRALVGEMADELSKFHAWEETRALVAKAREVIVRAVETIEAAKAEAKEETK